MEPREVELAVRRGLRDRGAPVVPVRHRTSASIPAVPVQAHLSPHLRRSPASDPVSGRTEYSWVGPDGSPERGLFHVGVAELVDALG